MRGLSALLLLSFAAGVNAAQVTVDFADVDETFPIAFESSGFRFEATGFVFVVTGESKGVVISGGDPYLMSQVNDSPFDLLSLDMGRCSTCLAGANATLTGYFVDGGTISQSISTNQTTDNLETFTFSPAWSGLDRIELSSPNPGALIDNIVVNVVPIPAAVWLFGSALIGLGACRRIYN